MISYFTGHPTAANLLMLMLGVLGLVSLPSMQRETFPDFSLDTLVITVAYPGASTESVEQTVVQRIEDALDGIENVEEIQSVAQEGVATITVEMAPGGDMTTFQADVQGALDAIASFPSGVEDPVTTRGGLSTAVVSIAVQGEMTPTDLRSYCEQLRRLLLRNPEIAIVEVAGFSDRQLKVRMREGIATQYGLSIDGLADTIATQSLDMPAGNIETRDGEILVRLSEERRSTTELADLIVVEDTAGGTLKLGDIAAIEDTFEHDEEKFLFNGQRAGLITISKTKEQDALRILSVVKDFLQEQESVKPQGVTLELTQDRASIVQERIDLLFTNGWQGLLLVFATLWLFFGARLAFWVAAGLPVSFLGAFFIMEHIGYSINMMTMVALLMALGLLMDDAIVLAENVAAQFERGKDPFRAVVDGVTGVAAGVFSSFLTTLSIFVPLAFLSGTMGKVLLVIPVVLSAVLMVSLIEAFLILPNHLSHIRLGQPTGWRRRFETWFEGVRQNVVGRATDVAVDKRYLTLGATIAAFIGSISMFGGGLLKFEAFPETEGNIVQLRLLLPAGTPLDRTEEVAARAEQALANVNEALRSAQPDEKSIVQNVSTRFNFNPDAGETGPHLVTLTVDLLPAGVRVGRIDDFLNLWRTEVGPLSDVVVANFTEPSIGPAGFPIEVRMRGDDLQSLRAATDRTIAWFREFEGVSNLQSDLRQGKPEVLVRMRPGALSNQLQAQQVANQLRSGLSGRVAREVFVGTEDFEIQVELARSEADSLSDLEYFQVSLGQQEYVPLGTIATLDASRGFARIGRINGLRTVTITGDVDTEVANAIELVDLFRTTLAREIPREFPGVEVDFEGESAETDKTMASMIRGFAIGLFAIFVLLSFQFRSYLEPIVVMAAIPLAFIGVIIGNLLLGTHLSMPGVLGFCALAGVVVNDSILLVEVIRSECQKGADVITAAKRASRARFRAVLLTSLTTMSGLIPLMFERSLQAQALIPIATSIVFGTLASTVLVLVVIPSVYGILGDFGRYGSSDPDWDRPSSMPRS
ncbi:MAG: efflux RND transporter permease subunit [Myxococcota bacterium]